MRCPTCDAEVTAGARFCAACGTALAPPSSPRTQADAEGRGQPAPEASATGDDRVFADDRSAPPQSPTGTLVQCPACDAPNSEARMLCGRCGADLVTGEQAPAGGGVVRPGPAVDVAGEADLQLGRSRSRTGLVLAAIIVVGALVGVGIGFWAVRADEPAAPAPATFDPSAYPDDPTDLRVDGVGASSTRPASGDTEYEPSTMVDADLTSFWAHDPETQAATDVDLAFALAEPSWVTEVVLANGAQVDSDSFAGQGRVRTMLLVVDGEPVVELLLQDIEGYQSVPLPEPVLAETVRFVVREVYAGDTFPEIALSEVAFIGHVATAEDAERVSG